ncbi:MAG: T9SS type A sorting domain-containing protein [Flavobacteriales bacterium]|nr:T9SS type A sorting domain-containing protein [Flavobacteriales bacterium]
MIPRYALFATPLAFIAALPLCAQLTVLTQFNPSNTGGTCGIAYNSPAGEIMVIGCSASTIDRYAEDGTFITSATMVGGSANDVDIDMSPADLTMNGTFVAQGQLLLVNGESGAAEIYAIDEATNQVIDTLVAGFGDSHVVGGSYHPQRGTFFLVQDNVPGGFEENRVAEIDATTGDTLYTFSVQPYFDVNYGDLDISPVSGNLFIVSSSDDGIAEFTADGVFITEHLLPVGVTNLSGIALDNDLQGAWVCNTSGVVFKLGNFPVAIPEPHNSDANVLLSPNPARERAQLTLEVTEASSYLIILRDMAGRPVRALFQGTLPMGRRTIDLDLSLISAGPYTVTVESATRTAARKLMVTR